MQKREADWNFSFGQQANIAASVPWRLVTVDGIAHGNQDDGQKFGLPQPVKGESRANELLCGKSVIVVEVDKRTADLRIGFDGDTRLDLFNNSSGYEGWQASVLTPEGNLTIIALGGGALATDLA